VLSPGVRRRPGERGQVIILFALAAVAVVSLVGLAIDGGRSYLDQRGLQASADTASDAGARMLAHNFVASEASPPGTTYSDANIHDTLQQIMSKTAVGAGQATGWTAYYTDKSGSTTASGGPVQVGSGSIPDWAAGVQVVTKNTHVNYVLQVVGEKYAHESATATSVYGPIMSGATAPYVTWNYLCAGNANGPAVKLGDTVTFRVKSKWGTTVACNLGPPFPDSFKGFLATPTPNPIVVPGTFQAGDGTGFKTEPTLVPGQVILIPMVDTATRTPPTYTFHAVGLIAVKVTVGCATPRATACEGVVVPYASGQAGVLVCPSSTFPGCSGFGTPSDAAAIGVALLH